MRAVREALGMTTAQLAERMNIKQPSVVNLEQSEAKGSIELATLRRAADRARAFARKRLAPVEHSMLLEDQEVVGIDEEEGLDEILRETNPRLFWD